VVRKTVGAPNRHCEFALIPPLLATHLKRGMSGRPPAGDHSHCCLVSWREWLQIYRAYLIPGLRSGCDRALLAGLIHRGRKMFREHLQGRIRINPEVLRQLLDMLVVERTL
jgi:hypothetical protein